MSSTYRWSREGPRAPGRLAALLTVLLLAAAAHAVAAEPPASTGLHPDGSSAAAPANPEGSPGAPTATRVSTGLNAVTNIAFGPDGSLWYGEWKTGAVYKVGPNGRALSYGSPHFDVGEPAWGNERGFVGLAIDRDGYFFTFHTETKPGGGWKNVLTRWTPEGQRDKVLFDNLDAGDWHNSGRIWVDPRDNTVWWAYGDVNKYVVAQDPKDLRGKILHMDRDGKPVPGNVAPDSIVYSLGHRQPFGFAVDPISGQVMVAENMDKKNDEVNLVKPGGNYGWPTCEGPCAPANAAFEDPVVYYPKTVGPSTGAFFHGDFYFGDFNYGQIHRIYKDDAGAWRDEIVYRAAAPPILDLKPGPEGNTLYYTSWSDIWKLTFEKLPANGTAPPTPTNGAPPTPSTGGGPTPSTGGGPTLTGPGGDDGGGEEAKGWFLPGLTVVGVAFALAGAALVATRRRAGRP